MLQDTIRIGALALVLFAVTACGGSVRAPAGGPGAMEPAAAVERFMQLAAVPDYVEMGWIFGTDRGAIIQQGPAGRRGAPHVRHRHGAALRRVLDPLAGAGAGPHR
jgi:hypothetical protein